MVHFLEGRIISPQYLNFVQGVKLPLARLVETKKTFQGFIIRQKLVGPVLLKAQSGLVPALQRLEKKLGLLFKLCNGARLFVIA